MSKQFVIYFHFVSWADISLGVSLDVSSAPHMDIHVPFGWVRIGMEEDHKGALNYADVRKRQKVLVGNL